MKKILLWAALGLAGCASESPLDTSTPESTSPNVLLVLVDDLGFMDLGYNGASLHETPNIDALASRSSDFQQAYSSSPVCSPTRAALLTGMAPERLQITDWIPGAKHLRDKAPMVTPKILDQLPLEQETLAERFRQQGYNTAFIGKWHLGGEGFGPEQQGFDINIGGYHKGSPRSYYSPYKNPKLHDGPKGEYLTDRLTQETLNFIEKSEGQPFFAMLSLYTVHTPIQAAKPYLPHYQQKTAALPEIEADFQPERYGSKSRARQDNPKYASMVHALDQNIGRLISGLERLGVDDNTIVVFTSDNGALSTLKRIGPASNLPLRAGKGWVYEGGIRVPLLVLDPRQDSFKGQVHVPVSSIDIAPTLLELSGFGMNASSQMDGESMLPLMQQSEAAALKRTPVRVYYPHYHGSLSKPSYMIREQNWKLVHFYESNDYELYDLKTDPTESVNLVQQRPDIAERLKSDMANWLDSVGAVQPRFK